MLEPLFKPCSLAVRMGTKSDTLLECGQPTVAGLSGARGLGSEGRNARDRTRAPLSSEAARCRAVHRPYPGRQRPDLSPPSPHRCMRCCTSNHTVASIALSAL